MNSVSYIPRTEEIHSLFRPGAVGQSTARILIAVIFLINGFGLIDQSVAGRELAATGVPAWSVPPMMFAGRLVEVAGGFSIALGIFPRLAAFSLLAFLLRATLAAHSFWLAGDAPHATGQAVQFSKNLTMLGGLLFVASTPGQPSLLRSLWRLFHQHD